ncbi:MAG TPA: hypothetical protein VIS07_09505 [Candidatus Binatia bacterium]
MFAWHCESCGAPADVSSAYLVKAMGWAVTRKEEGRRQTAICPRCLSTARPVERFSRLETERAATQGALRVGR